MDEEEMEYNTGGTFETTIGRTKYEVVLKFKNEGETMQEKALRVVKSSTSEDKESA